MVVMGCFVGKYYGYRFAHTAAEYRNHSNCDETLVLSSQVSANVTICESTPFG